MSSGSVGLFWWLSPRMKSGWRGIYSLHTKSNHYTQFTKLGETEYTNSVRPIQFKMWTFGFSMGPIWSTQWDRCARVRVKPQLGLTDYTNSVRPILVMSITEGWSSKLGGTEIIATRNTEFASPSRWDRDPIGETGLIRVSGSGYVNWTRWLRIERIGEAKLNILVEVICGCGKVVEGFGAYH